MPGDIVVPVYIFLYMSAFLNSIVYSNLIRAFWPDGNPDDLIRTLENVMPQVDSYNKKFLEIEYNFDITKTGRERVLIKLDCLLPFLGRVLPPGMDEYVCITELDQFIKDNLNLDYYYADNHCKWCSDYHVSPFKESTESKCEPSHFHHFSGEHIIGWFDGHYLYPFIL
ncbi:unnamed protein product [Euphydryas editha]|uniref:Uncharacterized protein n=1 Tax=Euphydryas editha TaxID=104508 RepID=A0AAU9UBJ6_EUPED|nr:unnamed protein product [Euphydryas editha]